MMVCPFLFHDEAKIVLEVPILTLLAFNFLFLIWVVIVSRTLGSPKNNGKNFTFCVKLGGQGVSKI